jgi:hypothetical protein
VVVVLLLGLWVLFTAQRLDRLHARVDAAGAALDAQLVRRAAALLHTAESGAEASGLADPLRVQCEQVARAALDVTADQAPGGRQAAENSVGRMLAAVSGASLGMHPEVVDELREAAARVQVARRFFNDAVRDTRALRSRRMPRLLRLAGHREMPEFFDIDDTIVVPEVKRIDL